MERKRGRQTPGRGRFFAFSALPPIHRNPEPWNFQSGRWNSAGSRNARNPGRSFPHVSSTSRPNPTAMNSKGNEESSGEEREWADFENADRPKSFFGRFLHSVAKVPAPEFPLRQDASTSQVNPWPWVGFDNPWDRRCISPQFRRRIKRRRESGSSSSQSLYIGVGRAGSRRSPEYKRRKISKYEPVVDSEEDSAEIPSEPHSPKVTGQKNDHGRPIIVGETVRVSNSDNDPEATPFFNLRLPPARFQASRESESAQKTVTQTGQGPKPVEPLPGGAQVLDLPQNEDVVPETPEELQPDGWLLRKGFLGLKQCLCPCHCGARPTGRELCCPKPLQNKLDHILVNINSLVISSGSDSV